jgi:hypothetical protein
MNCFCFNQHNKENQNFVEWLKIRERARVSTCVCVCVCEMRKRWYWVFAHNSLFLIPTLRELFNWGRRDKDTTHFQIQFFRFWFYLFTSLISIINIQLKKKWINEEIRKWKGRRKTCTFKVTRYVLFLKIASRIAWIVNPYNSPQISTLSVFVPLRYSFICWDCV